MTSVTISGEKLDFAIKYTKALNCAMNDYDRKEIVQCLLLILTSSLSFYSVNRDNFVKTAQMCDEKLNR